MRRLIRATCRAALALGCVATAVAPAAAAEWSFAPTLSLGLDTDSNRNYQAEGESSQSLWLTGSFQLERDTEVNKFIFNPVVRWQDFDRAIYGDIFERDINASDEWTGERSSLNLALTNAVQSTLTTEPTETGIVSAQLYQRLNQANLSSIYSLTERNSALFQLAYSDVSYYGAPFAYVTDLLSGYRYGTASVGDRYQLSEKAYVTGTVYSSILSSRLPDNGTHSDGVQLEYNRTFTERTYLDVAIGAVRSLSQGRAQTSGTGTLNLSHSLPLGTVTLTYSRGLTPYGTGQLLLRQQVGLTLSHGFSEKLDGNFTLNHIQNGQPVGLSPAGTPLQEVQTYTNAQLGLTWHPTETWKVAGEVDATHTQTLGLVTQPVHEWRASVIVTWSPRPLKSSF